MKYLPSKNDNFGELQKLHTYQVLNLIGCPVLDSVLIEEGDKLTEQLVQNIRVHLKSEYCTMRYQYTTVCSKPVRGGSRVKVSIDEINKSRVEGALLWLLTPTNRLTNLYGINMYFDLIIGRLIFECVGRGFDTSNINRGDMSPHQRVEFRLPIEYNYYKKKGARFDEFVFGWNSEWWKFAKFDFMSETEYRESMKIRLRNLYSLGYTSADERIFYKSYKPLSFFQIEKLLSYAKIMYESGLFFQENEFIANCSILENNRFVFWDVITPLGKLALLVSNRTKDKQDNKMR